MASTRPTSHCRSSPFSLILKWVSPLKRIHSDRRLRQAVGDRLAHVLRREWVRGADQMVHRHALDRIQPHVAVEVLTLKIFTEKTRQVSGQVVAPICAVAIQSMDLAVGVVQCGIQRTGRHQCTEFRDRFGEPQVVRQSPRGGQVLGFQGAGDIDRVPLRPAAAKDGAQARCELLHCLERLVVREEARRKRPGIAERHRAEAGCGLSPAAHDDLDIEQGEPFDDLAAEFQRRPALEFLKIKPDFFNVDFHAWHP